MKRWNLKKIIYFTPLFMLLGLGLIVGLLYLIFPEVVTSFISGLWYGVKAPVVLVLNIFGKDYKFYDNMSNKNIYNLGFLIGIFVWSSSPSFIAYQSNRK
jgi:hypothetical protein